MRNNQLFKVHNHRYFKVGTLVRMYYNDGSTMPMVSGHFYHHKTNMWCELSALRRVPNNRQNLRAFARAMRRLTEL